MFGKFLLLAVLANLIIGCSITHAMKVGSATNISKVRTGEGGEYYSCYVTNVQNLLEVFASKSKNGTIAAYIIEYDGGEEISWDLSSMGYTNNAHCFDDLSKKFEEQELKKQVRSK